VRLAALFGLSVLLLVAGADPATAGHWSRASTIGRANPYVAPSLAVSPGGWAVVGLVARGDRRQHLLLAVRRPGGRFSARRSVPGSLGGDSPSVAIDDRGRATIAWQYYDGSEPGDISGAGGCCKRVRAVGWSRGHFGRPRTVSPPHGDATGSLAVNRDGRAVLAWATRGRLQTAWARRSGFGPARSVALVSEYVERVFLNRGPGGAMTITWDEGIADGIESVLVRRSGPAARPRVVLTPTTGGFVGSLVVRGDNSGRQTAVMREFHFTMGGHDRLRTVTWDPGARPGPVRVLADEDVSDADLAVAPSGSVRVAAWGIRDRLALVAGHGQLDGPISQGPPAFNAAIAAGPGGLLALAFNDPPQSQSWALHAVVWRNGQRARQVVTLGRMQQRPAFPAAPDIAFDARGRAVAVWLSPRSAGGANARAAFYRP
jgi:hypothetical protein